MTTATNDTLNRAGTRSLSAIELEVLRACHELTLRNRESLPLLAGALQVPEEQVFYTWMFRQPKRWGHVKGTPWVYFPHGLECDVKNTADGRSLRIDFGPGGRVDTFTILGIVKFVMTSVAPLAGVPAAQAGIRRGQAAD